jgi:endoglucanase Acf2
VRASGGAAQIELTSDATAWGGRGEAIGITVKGHDYGLFAPTGASWEKKGDRSYVSELAGKGFFSVAVLPDHAPETLERFRKHAYAFVDDTRATWSYAPRESKLVTHFEVKTSLVEPGPDRVAAPIVALYPHQWKATRAPLGAGTYASPRGTLKIVDGGAFDVERTFHGVVPVLPEPDSDDARSTARSYLKDEAGDPLFRPGLEGVEDTYWAGKSLGRAATMAWIARQLGERDVEQHVREAMTKELADWFDGRPPKRFVYDSTWRTLIGYPSGYQSGTELNDHHFHYGYFLWAAATLAALDPEGGVAAKWGPFVRMLADDVADANANDPRFPRLRQFDVYAGHSWASGPAMFDDGNNEESSSEDANFAAGLALWGMVTGDDAARDLGVFLYETLVSAVEQYWLDIDHDVFPKAFHHPVAGIVWSDGARYDTWWSREPTYVHGINVLPITGASLYLGRHPDAIHHDLEHLVAENRSPIHLWREVTWMYEALDDAPRADAIVDKEHYFDPEFGDTWAAARYWIGALHDFGRVDTAVVADHPGFAVFDGPRGRTYAAFNPGSSPAHVVFSDGATLDVAPRALSHVTRPQH